MFKRKKKSDLSLPRKKDDIVAVRKCTRTLYFNGHCKSVKNTWGHYEYLRCIDICYFQ